MNTIAKILMAAAAVLAIAFVGIRFLGAGVNIGGPGPTPTPTASPAALPSPGRLNPGSYFVDEPDWAPMPYTFAVPDGWVLDADGFVLKDPLGPGEVMFTTWIVSHVFADACNDSADNLVDVGTTVEELASALVAQESREASQSTVTLGGYPATRVELSFPADLDIETCNGGIPRAWPDPGPDLNGGLLIREGQTQVVYILDIDGDRMVLVASHMPDSSAEDLAELQGVLDSIRIDPSDGESVARRWVDAVNQGDADLMTSLMAEDVNTGDGALARAEAVRSVLDTWCPITIDAIERVGDSYLVGATYRDDEGSTCTAGAPGTTGTFVLEIREGKVTRMP